MSRSSTTGIYTRVDNSFSNPIVGTTISPTDADTYFDDIDGAMNAFIGTSTTSLAIGLGAKSFTTQASKTFLVGSFVQAMSQADRSNYMYGTVTAYNSGTGVLDLNIVQLGGSGTLADWLLITAGARGGAGPIAGIRYLYSAATSDADPGAGTFRLNNATVASATAAYLDNTDTNGATVTTLLDLWDDSTNTAKGSLRLEKESDNSVWAEFTVTGSVVDGTGYRKLTLTSGASNGTFTAGDAFRISFRRAGDKGTNGSGTFPGSSTDNAVVRFDGTGGTTVQNSGVTISDSDNLSVPGSVTFGNGAGTLSLQGGIPAFEFGVPGAGTAPFIDFHSSASSTDYDARIIASGGSASAGAGTLTHTAANHSFVGTVTTSAAIELGHASDTTISRTGAGAIAVEGVGVALNSTSLPHTASQYEVGAASDTTISRASAGVIAVEGVNLYPAIPQLSKSLDYTLVLGDANTHILHPAADTNNRTFTIPANSSVAYPIGTTLTFINEVNTVTIAITTDTMTLSSAGTTGSRTLAANGMATAIKITSTKWMISGSGLT